MRLKIALPDKMLVDEDVISATLPCVGGQRTVLPGHDMLVTLLSAGRLFYRKSGEDENLTHDYGVGGGFVEILGDSVYVYAKSGSLISQAEV